MAEKENTPEKAPEVTTDYAILREQLTLLSKEFKACDSFLANIEKITDKILDHLDIEAPDSDEVSDLEEKIDDLENDICRLENTIEEYEDKYGKNDSFSDEYKIKFFLEYKDKLKIA